ncbi:MAG: chloride channel protein [Robiginitomaculum sp.]|nr:MAG: chloride channel protein [Robiginitomaculum sp.]
MPGQPLAAQAYLWLLGALVGVVVGFATLGFRQAILSIQGLAFGDGHERLASIAANLPPYLLILIPFTGGCVVSLLLLFGQKRGLLPEMRTHGVAEVIEARALDNARIRPGTGLLSAVITVVTLGTGGSSGREGPAVHIGASLSAMVSSALHLEPRDARTLLACGVAAAVAASFNAPLAGMLFALEVVLGHYALRVMAPTAVAATVGAVIAREVLGAQPAFLLPAVPNVSLVDFPAAILLGVICAALAIVYSRSVLDGPSFVQARAERLKIPLWALPPLGGALLGSMAIFVPEILGVGYEATSMALSGHFAILTLLVLIGAKILATTITLSFRLGGGIFSPSLFLGAMAGSTFGLMATVLFGADVTSSQFFAIIGMGAMSGAVLGAPISTTLIVFELTGSYEASIATLLAVSIATALSHSVLGGNIFHKQIEERGLYLREGPQRIILQTVRVREFMVALSTHETTQEPTDTHLFEDDTLGRAMGLMEAEDMDRIAVRTRIGEQEIIGHANRQDALLAYNRRLIEEHEERHT